MATDNLEKLEASLEASKQRYNKAKSDLGRRAARLANARRKQRTRRLIVLGSVLEKQHTPSDLIALLDQTLDRDQDRVLFDLPLRSAPGQPPLPGWIPARVKGGAWGARFQGDARTLPPGLEGLAIAVTARNGDSWISTVTEVLERSPDLVLVRAQKLPS